ncbi:MAG: glycosyltransferase family 4 protein [candidate division NC10 bacterium]|nr:glycosyltransferase family 4 protein [candidate division NC10 bacterium]
MSGAEYMIHVAISSLGRFHAFDLAEQMRQRGCLARLYTAYPSFKVDQPIRPFTRTFPWVLSSAMVARQVRWHRLAKHLNWLAIDSFDWWVARRVEPCDVFVHLSSFGLHAARRARKLGARIVCDRGSSHILYQDEILAEEFAHHRIHYSSIDRRVADKELLEYGEADLITVPSTFSYRTFVEKGVPPEKLRRIPYGVDLSLFCPLPKEDEIFRVLFVGGYSIQKGISYLFEAVRPLVLRKAIEVWFVGCPSSDAREILHRNADIFTDKGPHPRNKLSWFYSQASVLVQPSIQEGLSLVLAQAMACGLPVIATTNTGAEDLFTDGVEGFIVPIRDPKAIRDKIQWMLDNPTRRQEMGQAALQRVKLLGGWETYGEQALGIYSQLIGGDVGKDNS